MSCFVDLALKRTSVVNVIGWETVGSRDDACVLSQVDDLARLWRARDIVPFV